eukprot:scaffold94578_cov63-Phaeocystis_antarctica.AAC.2
MSPTPRSHPAHAGSAPPRRSATVTPPSTRRATRRSSSSNSTSTATRRGRAAPRSAPSRSMTRACAAPRVALRATLRAARRRPITSRRLRMSRRPAGSCGPKSCHHTGDSSSTSSSPTAGRSRLLLGSSSCHASPRRSSTPRTGSLPGKWPRGARARSTLRPLTSNSTISAYCRRAGPSLTGLPAGSSSSRPCSQKLLTGPPTKFGAEAAEEVAVAAALVAAEAVGEREARRAEAGRGATAGTRAANRPALDTGRGRHSLARHPMPGRGTPLMGPPVCTRRRCRRAEGNECCDGLFGWQRGRIASTLDEGSAEVELRVRCRRGK